MHTAQPAIHPRHCGYISFPELTSTETMLPQAFQASSQDAQVGPEMKDGDRETAIDPNFAVQLESLQSKGTNL